MTNSPRSVARTRQGIFQLRICAIVADAVACGVNYFDVAPSYGDAEIKLGPALEPYRKDVFLACKTDKREREGAQFEFNRSLERLRTDHFDLYQLHGIASVQEDVDPAFVKGGVMDMLIEKKKAGQIRFLGFSAHSFEAASAAMDRCDFDSALVPINFACYLKGNFGPRIIEKAKRKGVTLLAIKAMAKQRWSQSDSRREQYEKCWYEPLTEREEAAMGLRWTLSQPVTAAIPPGDERLFRLALDIALESVELSQKEFEKVSAMAEHLNPLFAST